MKAQGVIKGSSIVLDKVPMGKKLHEGESVDVIILPRGFKARSFGTFKLGVKKEHLKRESIYAATYDLADFKGFGDLPVRKPGEI